MRKIFFSVCFVFCMSVAYFGQTTCRKPYSQLDHALNVAAVKRIYPRYPEFARGLNVPGEIVARVAVDRKGNVKKANIICGHPLFGNLVLKTVQEWKFKPDFGGAGVVISDRRRLKTLLWDLMFTFQRD